MHKHNKTNFENTHTLKYGGYVMYFKTWLQLWKQIGDLFGKVNIVAMTFLVMVMIFKTPWWLLVKPLGCLFSKKTITEGTYTLSKGFLVDFSAIKNITMKFLGIPYMFWRSRKFTQDEKLEIAGILDEKE